MSAADNAGNAGVLNWPSPSGTANERIGRHRLGVRAALSWHRAFYTARHRR